MAFIPFIFNQKPNMFDSHIGFGTEPDEILAAISMFPQHSQNCNRQINLCKIPRKNCARAISRRERASEVSVDKDRFQVSLDVQHFDPEEISVKTVGGHIIIEAKHEEKQDDHGYISRHFVRKYSLPDDHKSEDVVSSLSSDGVLTITAPRRVVVSVDGERVVPITSTGQMNTTITDAAK